MIPDEFQVATMAAIRTQLMRLSLEAILSAHRLGARAGAEDVGLDLRGLDDEAARQATTRAALILIQNITDATATELQGLLREGLREGLGQDDLAPRIEALIQAKAGRARTIARTEINRAANAGRFTTWKRSGVVTHKTVHATLDDRVRDDHLQADGETVSIDEPFTRGAAAGKFLPPWSPNCRCTLVAVTKEGFGPNPAQVERTKEARALKKDRLEDEATSLVAQEVNKEIRGLRRVEERYESKFLELWVSWPARLWAMTPSHRLIQPITPGVEA